MDKEIVKHILHTVSNRAEILVERIDEEDKGFKRSFLEGELHAYREVRKLILELNKTI